MICFTLDRKTYLVLVNYPSKNLLENKRVECLEYLSTNFFKMSLDLIGSLPDQLKCMWVFFFNITHLLATCNLNFNAFFEKLKEFVTLYFT